MVKEKSNVHDIDLTMDGIALFVCLSAGKIRGRFLDNGFVNTEVFDSCRTEAPERKVDSVESAAIAHAGSLRSARALRRSADRRRLDRTQVAAPEAVGASAASRRCLPDSADRVHGWMRTRAAGAVGLRHAVRFTQRQPPSRLIQSYNPWHRVIETWYVWTTHLQSSAHAEYNRYGRANYSR
ncbi:hypothetical protein MRX96_015381 [Rhipicephalus microplus]